MVYFSRMRAKKAQHTPKTLSCTLQTYLLELRGVPYKWNLRHNCKTRYVTSRASHIQMSVSYVPRSLRSWVLTTHRSYWQLTFFNIFILENRPVDPATNSIQESHRPIYFMRIKHRTRATDLRKTCETQYKQPYTVGLVQRHHIIE